MNLFILALFAVPALSIIVWHFAFLIAVDKHYADRQVVPARSTR